MNPQGERWTTDQVLALAPDEASRRAGGKLAAPGPWSETGADGGAVWGQCKGSGKKPYQTVVDLNGPAFTCSCPSRKFPCKHALGLLLLWAGGGGEVPAGKPSPWADEWLAGRRERAERATAAPSGADAPSRAPADPEAARRRAERRMQRIGAGATELEQRLEDLLQSGLASDGNGGGSWDETAARMVDAQAPGLAARVRELSSVVASGPDWPARLLEECALLHLLDQGFLGIERLPGPLAATVRARVGLTTEAADLLTGPDAATVRDRWLVLAQQDSDDGMLLTRRIFLRGERTGRMALHLSFGGSTGRPLDLALPPGLVLDADLAYYPGARPLRATFGERHAPVTHGSVPPAVASMPPWPRTATRCATTRGWIPGRWCSARSPRYRAATGQAGNWPTRTASRPSHWTRAASAGRACGSWSPCRAGPRSRSSANAAIAASCR